MEVPIDYVRSNLTQLSFIRTIVLFPPLSFEAHLSHEFLNGLVVDVDTIGM